MTVTDGVKGGGAKGNVVVVVVGSRRGCGSGGLSSVLVLDSASLIRVCTFDASTCNISWNCSKLTQLHTTCTIVHTCTCTLYMTLYNCICTVYMYSVSVDYYVHVQVYTHIHMTYTHTRIYNLRVLYIYMYVVHTCTCMCILTL